jgi:hypothetical protein
MASSAGNISCFDAAASPSPSIVRILYGSVDRKPVGIVTGFRLDGRVVGVWVPVGARFSSSPHCRDRFGGQPPSHLMGTWDSFPSYKAAGAWCWQLTSKWYISTGTTLPYSTSGQKVSDYICLPMFPFLFFSDSFLCSSCLQKLARPSCSGLSHRFLFF